MSIEVDGSSRLRVTWASGKVNGTGDISLITPTSGRILRIFYLSYNPLGVTELGFKLGVSGVLMLRNSIVASGSIVAKDFKDKFVEGTTNDQLYLNFTLAVDTIWNAVFVEI